MVRGEASARGIEEVVRSKARGLCLRRRGGRCVGGLVVGGWCGGRAAACGFEAVGVALVSSQAARAAGSTGQADGGAGSVFGAMAIDVVWSLEGFWYAGPPEGAASAAEKLDW